MFYKEVFEKENPKGGKIFSDPAGAVKRCTNKDGTANVGELVYLLATLVERLGRRDDVQAKALADLLKK